MIEYVLRDPMQSYSWIDKDLFFVETLVDCGSVQIEFYNDD